MIYLFITDFLLTVQKKQRKADSENHQKCMLELAKQEELLHKLLNELK